MKSIKVGIDAFNDLAKSHDAHVKEVERLQNELDKLKNLKLVDQLEEEVQALKSDVMLLIERFDDKLKLVNQKNLKLVDQNNELLLECRIGDKHHRALLELGMTKLLEDSLGD